MKQSSGKQKKQIPRTKQEKQVKQSDRENQKEQSIPMKQAASITEGGVGEEKGEVCRQCGYTMRHLHRDECPMCKTCQGCGKTLMQCHCHEGE